MTRIWVVELQHCEEWYPVFTSLVWKEADECLLVVATGTRAARLVPYVREEAKL
jgi:hypothetical protein